MPQLENGYLKLANELVEAYTRSRIPGEAMQCLWFIIRKTYGFNKQEDRIAISQFSEATGLKKQHAHRAIAKLVELNLVTKNGDGLIVSYRINKDSSTWKLSPKKVTYPKKVTAVPKKGDSAYPKKVNTKDTTKNTKDIIYPSWIPMEEWNEFLLMRKKIKKPMTDYAIKLAINKLSKMKEEGQLPKDVLTQSIMGCYQGLFPVKQGQSTGRATEVVL